MDPPPPTAPLTAAAADTPPLPPPLVRRIHAGISRTALPTGVVVGVALAALTATARTEAHVAGRVLATYCAVAAAVLTVLLTVLHLSTYTRPIVQRRIVRIVWMAPLYAGSSAIALWAHHTAPYVGAVRDCYEAYVLYNFYHLLMAYLGGEDEALRVRGGSTVSHLPPLCCLPPFKVTGRTLTIWKRMLAQYVVVKPILAVAVFVLAATGDYKEHSWSPRGAHLYMVMIQNVSVTVAFTAVTHLFLQFRRELSHIDPVGKFAAIKMVIFLSFWQGVLAGLLVHFGVIRGSMEGLWTPDEVATGVQDFVITIEMLALCYAHHKVFGEGPYVEPCGYGGVRREALWHVLSYGDVCGDAVDLASGVREGLVGGIFQRGRTPCEPQSCDV